MLVDPKTGRVVLQRPSKPETPIKVGEGDVLIDPRTGKQVGAGPLKASKDQTANDYASDMAAGAISAIDDVLPKISGWTSGGFGSWLAKVPGTPAKDVARQLESAKGSVAFQNLAEMRAASKTGGALGAVSDREMTLLSSTRGSMEQDQSPDNLRRQLLIVKGSMMRFANAKAIAAGRAAPYPNAPSYGQPALSGGAVNGGADAARSAGDFVRSLGLK